jgi:hypothetical protein
VPEETVSCILYGSELSKFLDRVADEEGDKPGGRGILNALRSRCASLMRRETHRQGSHSFARVTRDALVYTCEQLLLDSDETTCVVTYCDREDGSPRCFDPFWHFIEHTSSRNRCAIGL